MPEFEAEAKRLRVSRRRRLFWRTAFTLLLLTVIGCVWLLHPVRVTNYSLLAFAPADCHVGLELRGPATAWEKFRRAGGPERLAFSPAAAKLREAARAAGVELPEEAALPALLAKAAAKAEYVLAQPEGLRLAGRSLRGASAIFIKDAEGKEYAAVSQLDNATWLLLRIYLAFKDESAGDAEREYFSLKLSDTEKLFVTVTRGLLVTGSSLELTKAAARRVENRPADLSVCGRAEFPDESAVFMFRADEEWRRRLTENFDTAATTVTELVAVAYCRSGEFRLELSGALDRDTLSELLRQGEGARTARGLPQPEGAGRAGFALPGTLAGAEGYLNPEFAWRALGRKLWDSPARPLRGVSQPFTCFFWEWLDRGVVAGADGRFALGFYPPDARSDAAVPPAPVLAAAWGVTGAKKLSGEFEASLRRLAEFYAAPGGSELYEKVRSETKLLPQRDGAPGRLLLQPLFFNYAEPSWLFPGDDAEAARFSTGALRQVELVAAPQNPGRLLAKIDFHWSDPAAAKEAVFSFLEDKIASHGFVPEYARPAALLAATAALETWSELPSGRGSLELSGDQATGFSFSMNVGIPLPAP